jgi:hypothetical protein
MNLLREYIKEMLTEDQVARSAIAAELRDNPEWTIGSSVDQPLFKQGRFLKQLFHKYADASFLNNLITIHWAGSPKEAIKLATRGSSKDEISTNAYMPGKVTGGSLGEYGVLLKGHVSLLANDMDDIWTGKRQSYETVDISPQRTQSSGLNKTIFRAKDPDTYEMGNPLLVLDKEDWRPNVSDGGEMHSNEALVDNWKVMGFVQAPWDTEDEELMDNELYVAGDNLGIPLLTVNDINKGMAS